jgi:hypothetical protein
MPDTTALTVFAPRLGPRVQAALALPLALATGVKGYILKGISGSELVGAIHAVHAGLPFVTPELASRLLTEARGGALLPKRAAKPKTAEDGTAPAEQRPASGEPVRPPSDGRPSDTIG